MIRRRNPLWQTEFRLSETPLVLGNETVAASSSDGLGWPDINAAVTTGRPHAFDIQFSASPDLWVLTPMAEADATIGFEKGRENVHFQPNTVFVMPPETPHTVQRNSPSRMLHVFIKAELLSEVAEELFDRPILNFRFISTLGAEDPGTVWIMRSIKELLLSRAEQTDLNIRYLARALTANLFCRYSEASKPELHLRSGGERLTNIQARRVFEYIEANISNEIRLDDLAVAAGLSRSVFILRFKTSMHQTPHQYVMKERVKRGMEMLGKTNLPIGAIASACGFSDHAHFSVVFKKLVNVSPSCFRRENQ